MVALRPSLMGPEWRTKLRPVLNNSMFRSEVLNCTRELVLWTEIENWEVCTAADICRTSRRRRVRGCWSVRVLGVFVQARACVYCSMLYRAVLYCIACYYSTTTSFTAHCTPPWNWGPWLAASCECVYMWTVNCSVFRCSVLLYDSLRHATVLSVLCIPHRVFFLYSSAPWWQLLNTLLVPY